MTSPAAKPRAGRKHLAREIVIALLMLAAGVLIAMSLSGVLALVMGQAAGTDFVAGPGKSTLFSDERCAEFFEHAPDSPSCYDAATDYNFDRLVSNRISIGVLGLAALGLAWLIKRRRKPEDLQAVPDNLVPTVATVIFSTAAFGLLAFSLMQLAYSGSSGIGADLAGGIVAAAAFFVAQRHAGRTLISIRRHEGDDELA